MSALGPSHYSPMYVVCEKLTDLGTYPNHPLPVGHRIAGWATSKPEVGHPFTFVRTVKATGEARLGIFQSTSVVRVVTDDTKPDETIFHTKNSAYRLTVDRSRPYDEAAIARLGA